MSPDFKRKNIRFPAENYRGRRFYFVTACFDRRHPFGAEPGMARWLVERLRQEAATKRFLVHAYCVMPDHVHVLAEGTDEKTDLLDFMRSFKQKTGFEFARAKNHRLWQSKFYDHVLRGDENPEAVAWYIWLNPVRKGMCRAPQEFAHSGTFTEEGMRILGSQPKQGWVPHWKGKTPG